MFTRISRTLGFGVCLVCVSAGSFAAQPEIKSSKSLKVAVATARTPEDHERVAAYCNANADRLDAEAANYEQAAAAARNQPVVKNLTAPNTAARYDSIAKGLRDEAQSNRVLAASQEQNAKNALRAAR